MSDNGFSANASHDLSGQIALVTGATSGLGWHFSRVLASAGAKVVITGRRKERLAKLQAIIEQDGGSCLAMTLDMTDDTDIVDVVRRSQTEFGTISVLVNNAGVPDAQYATAMSVDLIDRVLCTNLRGPYILSCEVARHMIAAKQGGRIVNISSILAFNYSDIASSLYSVTKAAVNRMTEVLAVEWAKFGINVNAIAPGLFQSEMTDAMIERTGEIYQEYPRKRLCVPAQLDSTLLYLCSPASECVTGTTIKVDDGQNPR